MIADRAVNGQIHLSFKSVKQITVEPADENRFMMTAKEATRACEQAQNEKEIRDSFSGVLIYLREWCIQHSETVADAYVCLAMAS